jgi:hypothetical protein
MGPTHCELARGPPVEVVPTSWTGTWTGRVGAVDPSVLEKDRLRGPPVHARYPPRWAPRRSRCCPGARSRWSTGPLRSSHPARLRAVEPIPLPIPIARRSSLPRVPVSATGNPRRRSCVSFPHWLRRPTERSGDPDLPGAESELAGRRCPGGQGFESLSATDDGPGRWLVSCRWVGPWRRKSPICRLISISV